MTRGCDNKTTLENCFVSQTLKTCSVPSVDIENWDVVSPALPQNYVNVRVCVRVCVVFVFCLFVRVLNTRVAFLFETH